MEKEIQALFKKSEIELNLEAMDTILETVLDEDFKELIRSCGLQAMAKYISRGERYILHSKARVMHDGKNRDFLTGKVVEG